MPAFGLPVDNRGKTLDQSVALALGLDPTLPQRPSFLPIARDAQGSLTAAWPQVAVDAARAFMLPGHAAAGGDYTTDDVTNLSLALSMADVGRQAAPRAMNQISDGGKLMAAVLADQTGSVPAMRGGLSAAVSPMDEAHEIARLNAVKMLGLPEGNTAMDRAKAMGLTSPVYHGTTKDFTAFDLSAKPNTAAKQNPIGVWTIKNRDSLDLSYYASGEGGNVMPLLTNAAKPFVVDANEHSGPIIRKIIKQINSSYGDDLPEDGATIRKYLKTKGHDSLEFSGSNHPQLSEIKVVFDPKNLRSTQAAFDPAKKNSADLLASLALVAALSGGASVAPQPNQPNSATK